MLKLRTAYPPFEPLEPHHRIKTENLEPSDATFLQNIIFVQLCVIQFAPFKIQLFEGQTTKAKSEKEKIGKKKKKRKEKKPKIFSFIFCFLSFSFFFFAVTFLSLESKQLMISLPILATEIISHVSATTFLLFFFFFCPLLLPLPNSFLPFSFSVSTPTKYLSLSTVKKKG